MPAAKAEPIDGVEGEFHLPAPGILVPLSPKFSPPILKGIKVHPDNPFRFDFILNRGNSRLSNDALKNESSKLVKYFLASLTIPEKDLWVNLSPYEKDRIIPQSFGLTEMGRDLLAEDYMLKQMTASLIYPEGGIGRKFWRRIYEEAEKKFGTTNIPVNTFNKVWIVPEKAVVYENTKAGAAYVMESKLKVLLEQDYLSLEKHEGILSKQIRRDAIYGVSTNRLGSQIVREIVIPQLTKEVNENENFVRLRQVYNSLILATWYKKKIKDSIFMQVYGHKNKIAGINIDDPQEKEKIYNRYLQSFKKGVYNYIKEEPDLLTKTIIQRNYFSGGILFDIDSAMNIKDTASRAFGNERNLLDIAILVIPDNAMSSPEKELTEFKIAKPHNSGPELAKEVVQTNNIELTPEEIQALQPEYGSLKGFLDQILQWRRGHPDARLVFINRHGESTSNLFNLTQSTDGFSPLTTRGTGQAEALKELLGPRIKFGRFLASDSERAIETIRPLAQAQEGNIETLQALREVVSFPVGGVPVEKENELMPENWQAFLNDPLAFGLTEIDSIKAKKMNLQILIDQVIHQEQLDTIISSHGYTIDMMLMEMFGIDYKKIKNVYKHFGKIPNAAITIVAYDPVDRKWQLLVKPDNSYLGHYQEEEKTEEDRIEQERSRYIAIAQSRANSRSRSKATLPKDYFPDLAVINGLTDEELKRRISEFKAKVHSQGSSTGTVDIVEMPDTSVQQHPEEKQITPDQAMQGEVVSIRDNSDYVNRVVQFAPEENDDTVENSYRNLMKFFNQDLEVLAFIKERKVQGFATYEFDPEKKEVKLLFIAVLPKSRRQGLGKFLWQGYKEYAKVHGALTIKVVMMTDNAMPFWKKIFSDEKRNGFKVEHTEGSSNAVVSIYKNGESASLGGIDLTSAKNILQNLNGGKEIKFHLDPAVLVQLQNAPGFVPVIISIQPMTSVRQFLEV